jgi:soluble lytic murein transglycosylase-like protein
MDALIAILALVPPAFIQPAAVDPVAQWEPLIAEAAGRFGIPADWIRRVMRAESGGRLRLRGRPIRSQKGAMGLMQVMPATYAEMARLHALGADPWAPRDNVLAGAAYLRAMYERFGYPGMFAAYNAGPARYAAYLRTGKGLPAETRSYLAMVAGSGGRGHEIAARSPAVPPASGVFFALRGPAEAGASAPASPPDSGLFVRLRQQDSAPK